MDLLLRVDPSAREPLYVQLYGGLRSSILDGRIAPGARLPSSRALAQMLGLARNTVHGAYDQLIAEGYLETRHGSGTYVAASLPDDALQAGPAGAPVGGPGPDSRLDGTLPSDRGSRAPWPNGTSPAVGGVALSAWGRRVADVPVTPYADPSPGLPYDFRHGRPDAGHFPLDAWRRVALHQLRSLGRDDLWYGPPAGSPRLRTAIAGYLGRARGVRCSPEQVIVTTGTQQALDLIARLTLDLSDPVVVEDPCYPGARRVFLALGARVIGVPVDEQGLRVAELPEGPIRLVYTTPSHQYPTGATLPVSRRLELLAWATRQGALVIEDDYDSEFRHVGRPLEAMQGLDRAGRVAYVGSFSKVLYPALRMGYLVVPPALARVAAEAKQLADLQTATPPQEALAQFIEAGQFEAHLRRMRRVYRARRAILLDALARELGGIAEPGPSEAGLYVLVRLAPGVDEMAVARRAAQLGVAVYPAAPYYAHLVDRPGLVLGYAALDEAQIAAGIRRLARAVREAALAPCPPLPVSEKARGYSPSP
ncbi:MAG: PLP-dependent aminotransferase family protein [Chloroflexota bacterium]|nr:PLP-dependent aminotransferase family protein [Chloroflexota bacterium]